MSERIRGVQFNYPNKHAELLKMGGRMIIENQCNYYIAIKQHPVVSFRMWENREKNKKCILGCDRSVNKIQQKYNTRNMYLLMIMSDWGYVLNKLLKMMLFITSVFITWIFFVSDFIILYMRFSIFTHDFRTLIQSLPSEA